MSDVLSQNEIDALLSALSTGEVDVNEIEEEAHEKKVRQYDFSRPDKFSKEQLRTLEIIHDNLGRLVNNFLSAYLRSYIDVAVLSTQSMVYSEFSNSVPTPAILFIVDFAPLPFVLFAGEGKGQEKCGEKEEFFHGLYVLYGDNRILFAIG